MAARRRCTNLLSALAALVGCAFSSSASFARIGDDCTRTVDHAALQAVGRTLPIGQTTISGQPVRIAPGVLRVEVEVFGPQTLIYAVDATVDQACNVVATSARLESAPTVR